MTSKELALMRFATFLLLAAVSQSLSASSCQVELVVVNGYGDPLEFTISRVVPSGKRLDLLTHPELLNFAPTNKHVLVFSKDTYAFLSPLDLFLRTSGQKFPNMHRVTVTDCPQRITIVTEPSLVGPNDSVGTLVVGKIQGCKMKGDWWVKVYPMFGSEKTDAAVEGTVRLDGTFRASGFMGGQRSLLVVGRGKEPIEVIGANIYTGKINQLGTIDLTNRCKSSRI